MNSFEVVMSIIGLVIPIIISLLVIINKMHNGRVDALDKREADNHKALRADLAVERAERSEERKNAEDRDRRIFDKLDKATDKIADLHASIVGNFVSKDDCGRCKEA